MSIGLGHFVDTLLFPVWTLFRQIELFALRRPKSGRKERKSLTVTGGVPILLQHFWLRGVAQSGSAHDWGSCGRWFESSHPDIKALNFSGLFYCSQVMGMGTNFHHYIHDGYTISPNQNGLLLIKPGIKVFAAPINLSSSSMHVLYLFYPGKCRYQRCFIRQPKQAFAKL